MTENELLKKRETPQSIGMGSYAMDSHNVQRYVKPDGFVQNEGDIGVSTRGPYEIAFRSILPKKNECENLVVPVCLSSSHIAFGSIRMEPVFMILGQSAATTAVLALDGELAVQEVSYDSLREQLLKDGQVLEYSGSYLGPRGIDPKKFEGVVVDTPKLVGAWTSSTSGISVGSEYFHDGNLADGQAIAAFEAKLADGPYEVRLAYAQHANRATNVVVNIEHASGDTQVRVNQRKTAPLDELFISLGQYTFSSKKTAIVRLSNQGTDGYVIADAVQFLPIK